jgi:hypothetical protein
VKFQIRATYPQHPEYGDVGLRLAEGENAEEVLLAFVRGMLSGDPPGGQDELRVPDQIVGSNGSSSFVARGVRYYAVPVPEMERRY